MATSSRDRITVDLRGLRGALLDRAKVLGVSPSLVVRNALAAVLNAERIGQKGSSTPDRLGIRAGRARLCLRMSGEHAALVLAAALRAGLNPGDYVGGLVAGVPVLLRGGIHSDHIAALRASSAELSSLSRNIHRLITLLRQGDVEAARPYRDSMDEVVRKVGEHLRVAALMLSDLKPAPPSAIDT